MPIKHEWQTTRNRTASVECSGPSIDVPGVVSIDIPEDPLQSERLTMALEILRLGRDRQTLLASIKPIAEEIRTKRDYGYPYPQKWTLDSLDHLDKIADTKRLVAEIDLLTAIFEHAVSYLEMLSEEVDGDDHHIELFCDGLRTQLERFRESHSNPPSR